MPKSCCPNKLGLISGLFFGFAFGIAGIASAVLGDMADHYGIEAVYNICAYMPLLGLVTWFLPDLKKGSALGPDFVVNIYASAARENLSRRRIGHPFAARRLFEIRTRDLYADNWYGCPVYSLCDAQI